MMYLTDSDTIKIIMLVLIGPIPIQIPKLVQPYINAIKSSAIPVNPRLFQSVIQESGSPLRSCHS